MRSSFNSRPSCEGRPRQNARFAGFKRFYTPKTEIFYQKNLPSIVKER